MPALFHRPLDRRDFVRVCALGVGAFAVGCRNPRAGARAGTDLRLALLSDTHVPADPTEVYRGFNPWENLRSVVPAVSAELPDGVLICGDVARLEGKEADYLAVKGLLKPLSEEAPIYMALGNHDDRDNFRKVFAPGPGPAESIASRHVLVINHPTVRLVVLDSLLHTNKTPGFLGKAQRDWLAAFLKIKDPRPIAIFVHHTLEDRDGDLLDAARFFDLIRPHRQVKAVFYGHSHLWEIRESKGLRLINLPALGYSFADKQPVGWVSARFHPSGVDLTLHAIAGHRADDGVVFPVRWS